MNVVTHNEREDLSLTGLRTLEFIASDPPATRRRYANIRVALPAVPPRKAASFEHELNRPLHSTGRGVAVSTMLGTTLAYVAYLAVSGGSISGSWRQLALGTAMVLAGAALGKVLGLFYWNLVFRRAALRLRAWVTKHQPLSRTHSVPKELPPNASVSTGRFH